MVDLRKTVNGLQNNHRDQDYQQNKSSFSDQVHNLFSKRFLHFSRNMKLLVCILVLPVIFEVVAMGFMKIRPPGDFDINLGLNRSMYPNSAEFYSIQNSKPFLQGVYKDFEKTCSINKNCNLFNSSKDSFNWLRSTHEQYIEKRYGGISFNGTKSVLWYNNKGYHSMPLYLNLLNSAMLRRELNDSSLNINTYNHPLKLGEDELSISSL